MNPRTVKTHVYLPGLSAHDSSHGRAAFEELNKANVTSGNIFVDTQEAQTVMRARYRSLINDRLTSNVNLSVRDRINLREQQANVDARVQVINPQVAPVPGVNQPNNGPADILWVKGHGSAQNANSISTRVEYQKDQGYLPTGGKLTVRRGYRQSHTATDIATSVRRISAMITPQTQSDGLDVRISSCGSAGTFRRDPLGGVVPVQPSFVGSVSAALDTQGANPRIQVSGFRGDSNSSHPTGGQFITKIKQKAKSANPTQGFTNAFTRMQVATQTVPQVGLVPVIDKIGPNHPRRARLDNDVINHLAPRIPARLSISPQLRATIQPYTKVEVRNGLTKPQASVPRSSARVPVPRNI